jgi:ABC-type uncharacterized transport system ATPase component
MGARHLFSIFVLFVTAGAASSVEETEYYALLAGGKKIGYVIQSRVEADGKVTTTQEMNMQVNRGGETVKTRMTNTDVETADGKPLGFKIVQDLGSRTVNVSGTIDSMWIVEMMAASMGQQQTTTFGWPSGAVMSEGARLLQIEKGLKEGTEYSIKKFEPGSKQAIEVKVRVGPKQNVDLLGQTAALTEVKSVFNVPKGGEIISTSYVDEKFHMKKTITVAMGLQTEMIACTKEFALGENEVVDMTDKMFVASPEILSDIESAQSVIYKLTPTIAANKLVIPASDNQSVEPLKEGGVIVTVRPVSAPSGVKFPYEGKDSNASDAIKPTSFLQSDNNDVIALAKRAVGETKDAAEAAKKIESFVSGYIEKKGLSVGYASAAETAASKAGDCSEFAVLTAAMCRAVGIPARVVSGLTYVKSFGSHQNVFGGHMWVEAYIGDKWIGLDATKTPKGFDAGHIALAIGNGEPGDFLNLAATLGKFKIEKVTINH